MRFVNKFLFILVLFVPLLVTTPIAAHSNYVSSNPSANAILTKEPTNVTIFYSEPVAPTTIYIQVYLAPNDYNHFSGNGYELDNGQNAIVSPTNPNEAYTPIDTNIPLNFTYDVYIVNWQTNSATDGHYTTGTFSFAVQYPNGTLPGNINSFKSIATSPTYFNIDFITKFIAVTLMIVIFMDNLLVFLVDKRIFQTKFSHEEKKSIKYYFQFIRISYLGSIAYCVSMVLWFIAEAIALESQHFVHVGYAAIFLIFDPNTLLSPFYFGILLRIGISLLMVFLSWNYYNKLTKDNYIFYSKFHWYLLILLSLSILIESITTHAGASNLWFLTVPIDFVHYFAVSIWAGGTIFVALIYYLYRNDFDEDFQRDFSGTFGSIVTYSIYIILVSGALLALFLVGIPDWFIGLSIVVWIIVTIMVLLGFYLKKHPPNNGGEKNFSKMLNSILNYSIYIILITQGIISLFFINTLSDFFSTLYGQIILLKIMSFGVILLFGYYNGFVLRKIAKKQAKFKKFVKNMYFEVVLALGIILLACLLSYVPPPTQVAANTSNATIDQYSNNVRVSLTVTPNPETAKPGVFNFTVFLFYQNNNSYYTIGMSVSLKFIKNGSSLSEPSLVLTRIAPYEYNGLSTAMNKVGLWQLQVTISSEKIADFIVIYNFYIS